MSLYERVQRHNSVVLFIIPKLALLYSYQIFLWIQIAFLLIFGIQAYDLPTGKPLP